ncbi:MAG: hypothetical protein U1D69_10710 [Polynucleobacter sp.]|nr:hypothetical protein [Polynucleobacter sp.]
MKTAPPFLKAYLIYAFVLAILFLVFFSYFEPARMVALTNMLWAMCGW